MRAISRMTSVVLVSSLLGGAAVAGPAQSASARRNNVSRVITIGYSQPCAIAVVGLNAPVSPTVTSCPDYDDTQPHAVFIKTSESFASVEIADDSGHPVGMFWRFNPGGVGWPAPTVICGKAAHLPADGVQYAANPAVLVGSTDCPYPPTSGTIKVTLLRS